MTYLRRAISLESGRANFTDAGRKVYAFYAEARLPVFGSKFTAPGLHALEFTAAARFEDFLDNDTNVLVPKFGVRWQPFDDSLTVRATWGEGFHEPSLIELFGIPIQGVAGFLHDPLTKTDIFDNSIHHPKQSQSPAGRFALLHCRYRLHPEIFYGFDTDH